MAVAQPHVPGLRERIRNFPRRVLESYPRRDVKYGVLLVLPAVIWVGVVILCPLLFALRTSFTNWHLLYPTKTHFVGLDNYVELLTQDKAFAMSMRNSLLFTSIWVVLLMLSALGIALLLNEQFRGRPIARSLLLVPWAIPMVVNGLMWKWILSRDFGALNGVLYQLGLIGLDERVNFLGAPGSALASLILASIWKATPFTVLILLAGLQTIPVDLYDAAKVDGCGVGGRLWHVTLPSLKASFLIALVLAAQEGIMVFDVIFVMTGGGPAGATDMLAFYIYRQAFQAYRMGYASALAYVVGILLVAFSAFTFKVLAPEEA